MVFYFSCFHFNVFLIRTNTLNFYSVTKYQQQQQQHQNPITEKFNCLKYKIAILHVQHIAKRHIYRIANLHSYVVLNSVSVSKFDAECQKLNSVSKKKNAKYFEYIIVARGGGVKTLIDIA